MPSSQYHLLPPFCSNSVKFAFNTDFLYFSSEYDNLENAYSSALARIPAPPANQNGATRDAHQSADAWKPSANEKRGQRRALDAEIATEARRISAALGAFQQISNGREGKHYLFRLYEVVTS